MDLNKLTWCKKIDKGYELIEPSEEIKDSYFQKADEALEVVNILKNKSLEWSACSTYYAMYNALYGLMMKIGIKCEIHDCSFLFLKNYLSKYFTQEELDLFENAKKIRIELQYYINNNVDKNKLNELFKFAPVFVVKIKNISNIISNKEINIIRDKIKKLDNLPNQNN